MTVTCPECSEDVALDLMWTHLIDGHPDSRAAINARLALLFIQAGYVDDPFPQEAM